MTRERTALYRLSGAGEERLYIGVAADPLERWRQHAKEWSWWSDVVTMTLEWYETRCEAEAAEDAAIERERPVYNLRGAKYRGVSVEEARRTLGRLVRVAGEKDEGTVLTVHGHPEGVIVSVEWYRRMREQEGEPVTWQFGQKPRRKRDEAGS